MKFTKIPEDTFKSLQLNAGMILKDFDPKTATVDLANIFGATSGGNSFEVTPTYTDFGEDIDNCPKNTMELKKLTGIEIKMAGTFITAKAETTKVLMGHADIDSEDPTHIVPRIDISEKDFNDYWWVGDYSEKNGESKGGFIAIHIMNALNTGGFKLTSSDENKGQFAYEFTAHFKLSEQTKVPYEVYIKAGTDEA